MVKSERVIFGFGFEIVGVRFGFGVDLVKVDLNDKVGEHIWSNIWQLDMVVLHNILVLELWRRLNEESSWER